MDLEGAFSAYKTAVEFEAVPSSETFCNLLSLTAGLGEQGSGQALVRETEPPHNLTAALTVYEGMLRHNVIVPERFTQAPPREARTRALSRLSGMDLVWRYKNH